MRLQLQHSGQRQQAVAGSRRSFALAQQCRRTGWQSSWTAARSGSLLQPGAGLSQTAKSGEVVEAVPDFAGSRGKDLHSQSSRAPLLSNKLT